MENELTRGPVMKTMLRFAVPMILGDLLQQCYNIADNPDREGRFLGADALAAVGSAFSLMNLSDFHYPGARHGERHGLLHPLRPER